MKTNKRMSKRQLGRLMRRERIAKRVRGTNEKPRLVVFKSAKHIYAQLVDDLAGQTLAQASTRDKELKGKAKGSLEGAKKVGGLVAKRAITKKIHAIVFDRSGYRYHGQLKALADAAREGGLKF